MQRAVGYKMHCSFVSPIPFNYAVQKGRRIVSERGVSATKTRPSPLVVETEVTISRGAFGVLSTVVPPSGKIQPIRAFLPACRRRSPSRVTKGRRRFLYHKTSSDDSGCGSAKVCLPQLCRMPKENDPGLCSTPHCEDDSEVLPTYSTEARGHLHVEHGLPRCGREHSRRFCGRLRRAKR